MNSERISRPLPVPDSPERSAAVIRLLYAYASAALCNEQAAYSAVSEAVISAAEKKGTAEPAAWESDALKTLMRLCTARAGETEPALDQASPLAPAARLPFQSRSDLALMLSELPADMIAAAGLSEGTLSARCGKAMRQIRFLQHGQAPDVTAMKQALHGAGLPEERASALSGEILRKLTQRQTAETPEKAAASGGKIHRITRSTAGPETEKHRTVRVPLWAMVCGAVAVCGIMAVLAVLAFRKPRPAVSPETSLSAEEELPAPEYIRDVSEQRAPALAEAQATVLEAAGLKPEGVVFLNTKLTAGSDSARYTVIFLDSSGKQYEYLTENGKAVLQHSEQTDNLPDTAGWRTPAELRQLAIECANLKTAVFTKEKLSNDGDMYYYKIEFTEDGSRNYSVYLNAKTGALIRYAVKEADPPDDGSLIPLSEAKAKALSRAGDLKADEVLFTKEKREGTVWMIAFTLDDGTQYTVELNARTGMANAVDVRPVSADTSQLLGTLDAKDAALRKAGLTDENGVRFTKAKIDRSNASYVYEFEFQTDENEYEATLNAVTGEVLKYRVWMV
ncbi:MAG: PepSY domain-containing protein [Oscillospiraceae bacterium]|nr:PepSY domain-containing protein [Oscillospiraceae bacterium]